MPIQTFLEGGTDGGNWPLRILWRRRALIGEPERKNQSDLRLQYRDVYDVSDYRQCHELSQLRHLVWGLVDTTSTIGSSKYKNLKLKKREKKKKKRMSIALEV